MIEAISGLPEDASVDDAIERLVLLANIEEGREFVGRLGWAGTMNPIDVPW